MATCTRLVTCHGNAIVTAQWRHLQGKGQLCSRHALPLSSDPGHACLQPSAAQ